MTGTTLFSVSRILSKWTKEGLVEAGRQRVCCAAPIASCVSPKIFLCRIIPNRAHPSGRFITKTLG